MSLLFELFYFFGYTPWDLGDMTPSQRLRDLIEGPESLSPGRAIDLGCGMGRYTIYLAQHGWKTTGVDSVERALQVARRRADERNVAVEFVRGDVTRLDRAGISGTFDLLLDSACFHHMSDKDRLRYGQGLTRIAAPHAQLLLFVFGHRPKGALGPRGAEREDIERSFSPAWTVISSRPGKPEEVRRLPPGGAAPSTWYQLQLTASPPR
jgi:SAM-dependent methyltransferase